MSEQGELVFLGTGASLGIPVIGCHCDVCNSSSLKNRRLRSSLLLAAGDKKILVDAGPDFRAQALSHKIDHLDGVFLTHAHFDHIGGFDELRVYHRILNLPLPCLLSKETYKKVAARYYYLLNPEEFAFQIVEEGFGPVHFADLVFHLVSYIQMGMDVLGFRIGNLAYVCDLKEYQARIIKELQGVDTLIVSASCGEGSRAHLSFDEAIGFGSAVGAKQIWLTHLGHGVEHERESRALPSNTALAYDGLSLKFSYD